MIHDAPSAYTRDGKPVYRLAEHKGLLRGEIEAGVDRRGYPVYRPLFWLPDGRLTQSAELPSDLDLSQIARAQRTSADAITARTRVEMIEFDAEQAFDRALDQGDLF